MAAEVLYTRVPAELKAALESYAQERAQTTSSCVSELLGLGFEAATKTRTIANLSARIAELEAELATEIQRRSKAEQINAALSGAAESWSKRAKHTVGECKQCDSALRGEDVMVSGSCPTCGTSVGLTVEKTNGLRERDLYLLAGAAGVVLGMLLVSSTQ